MITIKEIRDKVNQYPDDGSVDDLLDELVLMCKIEKGVQEADAGKGIDLEKFEKDLSAWWQSK